MCVILSLDEFYVSPVTSSIKGWVGGFAPFRDGNFRLSLPSFSLILPTLENISFGLLTKKATPFGPNGRKVLKLSPMKKECRHLLRQTCQLFFIFVI